MFENVLGQNITKQLAEDIRANKLPPSILFFGPNASAKFTTALELARAASCSEKGAWGCNCPSCIKHKEMTSPDLVVLGARDHIPEIKAASEAFLKTKSIPSRYLFLRSIRKLTLRFDARLWDSDEQRFMKAAPIVSEIEELLSTLSKTEPSSFSDKDLQRLVEELVSKSMKLQESSAYDAIPINQVRKVSSWVRLMPTGSKKILIIENADKMQEGARNAFLKILEEPPAYAIFVLTTEKKSAIMPTILSRVRPYKFDERKNEVFEELIRRVFKGENIPQSKFTSFNLLKNFLYSFLPVDFQTIQANSALFFAYIFKLAKREGKQIPAGLHNSVEKFIAENNISGENNNISTIINALNKFKPHTIFVLFLNSLLLFLKESLHQETEKTSAKEAELYFKISKLIKNSELACGVYNISAQASLENLAEKIKELF